MPNEIEAKTILNKKKRRDSWFLDDYTVNPYSGCAFNCLFCYIRGSKYGIHMERKLGIKINALEVLEKQLANRAKKNQQGIVVIASATEPYQQAEKKYELTRGMLELMLKYRFPVHIITRSDLILRDFDLLREIDKRAILPGDLKGKLERGVIVSFSFSTIDDGIAKIFEPGATPPSKRLETLKDTVSSGFLSGVSMMPLLPYISDTGEHQELMFGTFKEAGAKYVMPAGITLFGEGQADSKALVFRAVEKHYPELTEKYVKLFGKSDYLPFYYSNALKKKTTELLKKYGLRGRII